MVEMIRFYRIAFIKLINYLFRFFELHLKAKEYQQETQKI